MSGYDDAVKSLIPQAVKSIREVRRSIRHRPRCDNSTGTVYVSHSGGVCHTTTLLVSPRAASRQLDATRQGVAVDPSDDHVYVDEGNRERV